jgi:hypothetical protein
MNAKNWFQSCWIQSCCWVILWLASPLWAQDAEPTYTAEQLKFFEAKIRPILVENCYSCHSSEGQGTRGGLGVDTRESLLAGGESGAAIVPGKPEESLLWNAINYEDFRMPPRKQLPPQAIADIKEWIEMGAPDPRSGRVAPISSKVTQEDIEKGRKFWSFQPPFPAASPELSQLTGWCKNDVDRFVAAKLETEGLKPVQDAAATTLLRRLYFDLIGLPPTPAEIAEFVKSHAEGEDQAIATVVDRLLESPHYGERWGRHWLDVARYAESTGKEVDQTFPFAWRYRDYVIDSFQKDKPYDRFIQEQIAGDLLPAKTDEQWQEQLIATGFLAIGPKALIEQNPRQFQADLIDEQIDTVTRVVMGVSVACARCHDHKFDPIRQADYYALAGIFGSTETFYGGFGSQRNRQPSGLLVLPINDKSTSDKSIPIDELKQLKERLKELEIEVVQARRQQFMPNANPANRTGTNGNSSVSGNNPTNDPRRAFVNAALLDQQVIAIKARLATVDENGKPISLCMGVQDRNRIANARLLERGEIDKAAQEIPRGFVALMDSSPVKLSSQSSGRLEMAKWMTHPSNPLTARVMVNRIWQHLIGKPLVAEPDNFGMSGPGTKQQALLDHLAVQFMEEGWSVKKLIRHIATSHVYRLSSSVDQRLFEKDPDNEFLARGNRRRLDAESIRDAMLFNASQIDIKRPRGSLISALGFATVNPAGPMPALMATPASMDPAGSSSGRVPNGSTPMERMRNAGRMLANTRSNPLSETVYYRSVYLPIARNFLPRSLAVFDFAEPSMVVPIREISSTADQALYMLNNDFVIQQSEALARRLTKDHSKSSERVRQLFMLSFGRPPTSEEVQMSLKFVTDTSETANGRNVAEKTFAAWCQLCQAMMATAEFRWLD